MKKTISLYLAAAFLLGWPVKSVRADILYVSSDGASLSSSIDKFDSSGHGTIVANDVSDPISVAFDSAGSLYTANYFGSSIKKYSQSGTDLGTFASPATASQLEKATGLAFDSAGNLFVANSPFGASTNILKFNSAGVFQGVFANTGSGSGHLAFDSAGNLYEASGNSIVKFTSTGSSSLFISLLLPAGPFAFDHAGNLYVAENSKIEKFSSTGTDLGTFANTSGSLGNLAFDSVGNLYETHFAGGAPFGGGFIEKFSATGLDEGVFANDVANHVYDLAFTDDAGVPLPLANQRTASTPDGVSTGLLLVTSFLILLGFSRRQQKSRGEEQSN